MKRQLSTAAFLLTGALAFGQAAGSESAQPQQSETQGETRQASPTEPQQYAFSGCLVKAGTNYIVTAEDGKRYKLNTVTLDELDQHVGRKIDVKGHELMLGSISHGVTDKPADIPVNVETVRAVAGDCSEIGGTKTQVADSSQSQSGASSAQQQSESAAAQPVETPTGQQPSNAGSMAADSSANATSSGTSDQQADSNAAQAERSAESAANTAERGAESAAGTVERGAERTGEAVAEGAERTGEAISSGAQSAAGAVERGAESAAATAERGAERVGIGERESDSAVSANQQGERTMAQANRPGSVDEQEAMLPQTASPIPLIALIGLGSLVGGIASRRRK